MSDIFHQPPPSYYDDEVRYGTGWEMIAEIKRLRERVAALTDENNILGDIIRRQEARLSPVTDATAIISADLRAAGFGPNDAAMLAEMKVRENE